MGLYQINIFGKSQKVIQKNNKEYKPKKLNKKNETLKQKLKILYTLYDKLYKLQNINLLEQREIIKKGDIIVYVEDRQAEPVETKKMNVLNDIDKRIEITQEKYEFMKELQCKENK